MNRFFLYSLCIFTLLLSCKQEAPKSSIAYKSIHRKCLDAIELANKLEAGPLDSLVNYLDGSYDWKLSYFTEDSVTEHSLFPVCVNGIVGVLSYKVNHENKMGTDIWFEMKTLESRILSATGNSRYRFNKEYSAEDFKNLLKQLEGRYMNIKSEEYPDDITVIIHLESKLGKTITLTYIEKEITMEIGIFGWADRHFR